MADVSNLTGESGDEPGESAAMNAGDAGHDPAVPSDSLNQQSREFDARVDELCEGLHGEYASAIINQLKDIKRYYGTPVEAIPGLVQVAGRMREFIAGKNELMMEEALYLVVDEVATLVENPHASSIQRNEAVEKQAWLERQARKIISPSIPLDDQARLELVDAFVIAGGYPYDETSLSHIIEASRVNQQVVVVDMNAGPVPEQFLRELEHRGVEVTWMLGRSLASLGRSPWRQLILPHPDEGWRQKGNLDKDLDMVIGPDQAAYLLIDGDDIRWIKDFIGAVNDYGLSVYYGEVRGDSASLAWANIKINKRYAAGPCYRLCVFRL